MDKWDKRFMEVAALIATWASCYQPERKIGAVIVKNKRILTTGYNGAPAGIRTCVERGECMRKKQGIASGTRHELCYAIHAEQNAIIQAAKLGVVHTGRHAVLHPSALRDLREDDRQRRHFPRGLPRGLPGRICPPDALGGRCETGTVRGGRT